MSTIERQIFDELHKLAPAQQARVLDYTRSLSSVKGVPGASLLTFSNTIDKTDLEQIAKSIEEGCEQVNPNEW
jgi:energy-coupling factor transporter transmembrane protein EcfT